ncbi:hypothetical protein [Pseudonocardia acaciae]|uniref:hypothetical protein n=1 Tax=Pseudonocardia acaciae TaxID=551276 RepID=UPI00068746FC|nr:hypothetical protein [Pseudonocardia acaciae]
MVAAYWRGEITLRKLRVLVQGLPPGGAAFRAVRGHGWTEAHYLAAELIDAVNAGTTATYRAAAGGKRVRSARPYPRPGGEHATRLGDRGERSSEEVVAYLDSLKSA